MRRLLSAIVVTLIAVSAYGFVATRRDRLGISARDEQRDFIVTISLRDITPEYRWLSVYVCQAALSEDSPKAECTYHWERESGQETRSDQVQYPFRFRNAPRGHMWIFAMAFDAEKHALARNEATVLRGF